jgi:valyl-tRNA synthetase
VIIERDPDVLDTWFSSALWTFSTLGWPEKTPELKRFHPTQVLVTGFDIIFFWVARMMMFTLYVMRDEQGQPEVPFQDVYVTGLIRDENGQKMSKSKGNVIDPLDLIDGISADALVRKRTEGMMQPQKAAAIEAATRAAYPEGFPTSGTDALRFTLTSLATTGRDVKFDVKRLAGYRNFCNKLWNAARFVRMQTLDEQDQPLFDPQQPLPDMQQLTGVERWMWSRLQHTSAALNQHLAQYRFDLASQALYDFVWNEYCDWFVELSKLQLRDEALSDVQKAQIRHSLMHILEHILRLAHPFMPFISEEIWLAMRPLTGCTEPTLMHRPYPQFEKARVDAAAEADVSWMQSLVTAVRTLRAENNIAPSKPIELILQTDEATPKARVAAYEGLLMGLTRCTSVAWLSQADSTPAAATQVLGEVRVLVPLAGLVDVGAELSRLDKQIEKQQAQQAQLENKLGNERFVAQAPPEVVAQAREKLAELNAQTELLQQQRAQLAAT